jgi:hypothetical protein
MYYRLTEQTKELFIGEIRRFWATHPKYKDLVDNIQGKFSFDERPQYGIIVKTGSASKVQLAPDNYVGRISSYVSLAKVAGYPGLSAEWVREDTRAILDNNSIFPSLPGVYYIEITGPGEFHVDPLLYIENEEPISLGNRRYQLSNIPVKGSVKIYEKPHNTYLIEDRDYTVLLDTSGKPTGEIELSHTLYNKFSLSVSYRYPDTSKGPFLFKERTADNKAIPGCVLGFGRRIEVGDRFAVVVTGTREDTAMEYGGKWQLTVDLDITARDVYSQQEIADMTVMYIWTDLRPRIGGFGIDITDVSLGGESEEIYDENGDDYFYNSSISITLEADWAIYYPLHYKVRGLSNVEINLRESLGLQSFDQPYSSPKLPIEKIV